jgi:uncharacterized protein with HEPN domain
MKTDELFLKHMIESIEAIFEYTKHETEQTFKTKRIVQSASLRELEIIGEAVKNLSEKTKEQHKQIPWKIIAATRDKITHHYFGIDTTIIWNIIKKELPNLKKEIQNILNKKHKEK